MKKDARHSEISSCNIPYPQDTDGDMSPYFNIRDTEHLRWGSHLPHWHQNNKYVFVTFRLADSIPQEKIKSLLDEKEAWLKGHPKPWSDDVEMEYRKRFTSRIDKWLDNGYGECLLKRPGNRKIVEDALFFFHDKRYHLKAFVVMPNHVHLLLQLFRDYQMESVMKSIKSFTAKKINEAEHRSGRIWQRESYDHIVRDEDEYKHTLKYIYFNNKELAWIEDDCIPYVVACVPQA